MVPETLRFGILGTGFIAHKFAATFAGLNGRARLTAVASRDRARADGFAREFGIRHTFGSYLDLARSDAVDVIYVATPHNFHLDCIRLCAENGKHVLCEKPITVNRAEAETVRELSERYGVFVMEAYWSRFTPAFEKMMDLLHDGSIGPYRFMRAEIGFSHPGARRLRKIDPLLAGGALLDVGVYNVMMAGSVFGYTCRDIVATARLNDTGVDLYDAFSMRYEDGSVAYLMDTVRGRMDNKAIVYGDRGCLTLHNFLGSEKLTVDVDGEPPRDLDFPFACNGFEYEILHVCDCIRRGLHQSDRMPLGDSIAIMGTVDRIAEIIGLHAGPAAPVSR